MGKDNRPWRKLVKKLRRSRIRKTQALQLLNTTQPQSETEAQDVDMDVDMELVKLEEEAWKEREAKAQKLFQIKCQFQIFQAQQQELLRIQAEEKRLEEQKLKEKRDKDFDQFLDFLLGNIDAPPLEYITPTINTSNSDPAPSSCLYFSRTGACRFGDSCNKPHPKPTVSTTLLLQNFFHHALLQDENCNLNEGDLNSSFLEFYEDVLPEFQTVGKVVQFKVSRNYEPHLRGNVWIEYENLHCAVEAYRKFHGRYYDGKALSVQFVQISSWRNAICGAYKLQRCLKGKSCNYIHSFRNPTKEFVGADNDWVEKRKTDMEPKANEPAYNSNISPGNQNLILGKVSSAPNANNPKDNQCLKERSRSHSHYPSENTKTPTASSRCSRSSKSRNRSRSRSKHRSRSSTSTASKKKKKKKHKKHKHKSKEKS